MLFPPSGFTHEIKWKRVMLLRSLSRTENLAVLSSLEHLQTQVMTSWKIWQLLEASLLAWQAMWEWIGAMVETWLSVHCHTLHMHVNKNLLPPLHNYFITVFTAVWAQINLWLQLTFLLSVNINFLINCWSVRCQKTVCPKLSKTRMYSIYKHSGP